MPRLFPFHASVVLVFTLLLSACASAPGSAPGSTVARGTTAAEQTWHTLRADFARAQAQLRTPPADSTLNTLAYPYSAAYRQRAQQLDLDGLTHAQQIDANGLNADAREQWELFVLTRREALALAAYPQHLLALTPRHNPVLDFARDGSGAGAYRFATVADYDAWAAHARGFGALVDQLIETLQQSIAADMTPPAFVTQRVIEQLDGVMADDPRETPFWTPINNLPDSIPRIEQERLVAEYEILVADRIIAACQRLRDVLQDDALPVARSSPGLSALPNGAQWYALRLRQVTSTTLSGAQLHDLGLAQIQRLRTHRTPNRDALPAPFFLDDPDDLGQAYRQGLTLYHVRPDTRNTELRAAAALVLDTGVHAKNWSTDDALRFWQTTTGDDTDTAMRVLTRVVAEPARASATTVGLLKLRELRDLAQAQLGASFDAQAFDTAWPRNAELTLTMATRRFSRWLAAQGR